MNVSPVGRYIILVLVILIGLHSLLSFTHEGYNSATSISSLTSQWRGSTPSNPNAIPEDYYPPPPPSNSSQTDTGLGAGTDLGIHQRKANATFVMLARNSDIDGAVRSMREAEDRFNKKFGYPWVFLNEEPFTDEFKKRISVLTDAPVHFGQIPASHWYQPSWIDEDRAAASRNAMVSENVIYGGSVSYRNMCRFNSGFFFKHDLLQPFRYYWRVEPDVHFHCDVDFDPFLFMQDQQKIYGFTITMYEYERTITTLWDAVKDFMKDYPQYVSPGNAMNFLSDNGGSRYNLCHFWSNFEIADMDFWRGEAYSAFFDYLDKRGGFYYERWGDAPVHSIAAALFARSDQIHFFNEIGYEHNPYTHCPQGDETWKRGKCSCDQGRSFGEFFSSFVLGFKWVLDELGRG
ncbi:glycosyltransferase family 15 protein [Jaapia argillacea MUCL 33604]|uniref:Glycosyltransferase family 15 protein n=1 Tax=Jaapia argillacea MUCL 33604 TaxID=933084 RepID=A0A067PD72_9AGAM|nr:glycosyltransferase family 15 protein [Jaapia argillacea MUCL 33604]